MTRSIFDPTGDTERSGSRFTGPDANQDSHLPTDANAADEESEDSEETINDDTGIDVERDIKDQPASPGDPIE